jgi:hypothetical protein
MSFSLLTLGLSTWDAQGGVYAFEKADWAWRLEQGLYGLAQAGITWKKELNLHMLSEGLATTPKGT